MSETSLVEAAREIVERAPAEVLAVYLYGSRARGTSRTQSDMDLGILLRDDPPRPHRDLHSAAEHHGQA